MILYPVGHLGFVARICMVLFPLIHIIDLKLGFSGAFELPPGFALKLKLKVFFIAFTPYDPSLEIVTEH